MVTPLTNPKFTVPLRPFDVLRQFVPVEAAAASDRLGWSGIEAIRYRAAPSAEFRPPAATHHLLFLFSRPPEALDLVYEGVRRHVPPPAGSISLIPAGLSSQWRYTGRFDSLLVFMKPDLLARVAAEEFDLDPARLALPPLDGLDIPNIRAALVLVDNELSSHGLGGPLAAESLANLTAVQLLRHMQTPRQPAPRRYGCLPRAKLRTVVEYIEEHLDGNPTLDQMAALARLSPNYFVTQFKRATGMPPYQYVIQRRVERARQLLQTRRNLSLAQIAVDAGFADQSQFTHHFKRLVGVTPGQFSKRA